VGPTRHAQGQSLRLPAFPGRWRRYQELALEAFERDREAGRRKDRAEAFARAWRRWLGPTELLFTHRTEAGRDALALAGSQPVDYETSTRKVWV
jgi:hypothetical protein